MDKVIGNTVGVPNPKSDWNQTDETKADFIKNKPDVYNKKEIDDKLSDIQVSGGGDEPFIIVFDSNYNGNKTHSEICDAVMQGKNILYMYDYAAAVSTFSEITMAEDGLYLYQNNGQYWKCDFDNVWSYSELSYAYIAYVNREIGNIETALDGIIDIQNSLIGGDGV